jgi:DNA polymerase-3 subunit beta
MMKFAASTAELQRALNKLGGVVPTKSTLPIDTLTLTATDMEISLTVNMTVKGEEDGKIAIPAKRLMDTVRSLDSKSIPTISADITTNKVSIVTANGQYGLTGESAKEFPAISQFKGEEEINLEVSTIKKIINRTTFAVSTDELRPAMMGVYIQSKGSELLAVATDGHRLVKVIHKLGKATGFKRDIIIPAKALHTVSKAIESGNISMSMNDTHIMFSFDNTTLVSRLIDETYPNYESVIPTDNDKTLKVSRDVLISSIRRVSLYANATTHQVKFDVNKSDITISAQDLDFGGEAKESIECEFKGEKIEIGFNSSYVIDMLTHLESDKVMFKFSSPTRAGIVSPENPSEGEDITMLVMPVRLTS